MQCHYVTFSAWNHEARCLCFSVIHSIISFLSEQDFLLCWNRWSWCQFSNIIWDIFTFLELWMWLCSIFGSDSDLSYPIVLQWCDKTNQNSRQAQGFRHYSMLHILLYCCLLELQTKTNIDSLNPVLYVDCKTKRLQLGWRLGNKLYQTKQAQ